MLPFMVLCHLPVSNSSYVVPNTKGNINCINWAEGLNISVNFTILELGSDLAQHIAEYCSFYWVYSSNITCFWNPEGVGWMSEGTDQISWLLSVSTKCSCLCLFQSLLTQAYFFLSQSHVLLLLTGSLVKLLCSPFVWGLLYTKKT